MRLGILPDVHGNRIARKAVLADGHTCGVDRLQESGHPAHDYLAAMFRRGG